MTANDKKTGIVLTVTTIQSQLWSFLCSVQTAVIIMVAAAMTVEVMAAAAGVAVAGAADVVAAVAAADVAAVVNFFTSAIIH